MQSEDFRAVRMPILSSWDPAHLVRTNTAYQITGIPERTLRYLAQKRILNATRIGKRSWYFRLEDLLRFSARRAFIRGGEPEIPLQMLQHLQGKSNGGLSPLPQRGAR
jgi:hypothetical protein